MGLANHFGDQAYQCKSCGHKMALYAPCCPVCLNKTLAPIKTDKVPEGYRANNVETSDTSKPASPIAPIVGLLIILAIGITASYIFAPPKTESTIRPDPAAAVESTPKAQPVRVSNYQSNKHNKHPNTRPVVAKTHAASTASFSAPKPVTKMKLWEASSDDEGGSP